MTQASSTEARTSSPAEIDAGLAALSSNRRRWAELAIAAKVRLLEDLVQRTDHQSRRWVDVAAAGKQLPMDSPWLGEEWISGPWALIGWLQSAANTLRALEGGGTPKIPKVRALPDGRAAATVFPMTATDRLLLNGYTAEVWMQEGVTPATLGQHVASFYRSSGDTPGAVAVVLGAGNITSIPVLDALYQLFVMGQVVMVKLNSVSEWMGPVFEEVFSPLVDACFLRFAYGGPEVGRALTMHPLVDELHLTGSERTYESIVYGEGDEGRARKARDEPLLEKPFTAELGGVGGMIVVPGGRWTDADIRFQAEAIVTAKLHNSGHNCVAAQVVVLPESWEYTAALERAIQTVLAELPPRAAWYPGSGARQQSAVERHERHRAFAGAVPRTVLTDVPADDAHFAFREEFFGVVLAITRLPGDDPATFWRNAVAFANESLHGTLGVNVIVHPRARAAMGAAFDDGIVALRFGAVAINVWNAAAYLFPCCTWGAYPGHTRTDIQSGQGVVHNALMFDRPEKTVAQGPFSPFHRAWRHGEFHLSPKPLWFVTHRLAHVAAERVVHMAANPSPFKLPGIFAAALRG